MAHMKKIIINKSLRPKSHNQKRSFMIKKVVREQVALFFKQGFSQRQIAKQLGLSRITVKKYINDNVVIKKQTKTNPFFIAHKDEIRDIFLNCGGKSIPAYNILCEKYGDLNFTIRTFQRHVRQYRAQLSTYKQAIRYETQPGEHIQIDFGECDLTIGEEIRRVHFFVGVLGFSRRIFAKAYMTENQVTWFDGLESAFEHFGGATRAVVCDNSRCLVDKHQGGITKINDKFKALCVYYKTQPIPCTPHLARSKGKCERMVRYIKDNAFPGREFKSIDDLNAYLVRWCKTADHRLINTKVTKAFSPFCRFVFEKDYLIPLEGKPKFCSFEQGYRIVSKDGLICINNHSYMIDACFRNRKIEFISSDNTLTIFINGEAITLDKTVDIYKPKMQRAQASFTENDTLRNVLMLENEFTPSMQQYDIDF